MEINLVDIIKQQTKVINLISIKTLEVEKMVLLLDEKIKLIEELSFKENNI